MEFGKQHLLWMVPVGIFFLACDGGIIGIIFLFFLYCYLAVKEEEHYWKEVDRMTDHSLTMERHERAEKRMETIMKHDAAMKNNTTDDNEQ